MTRQVPAHCTISGTFEVPRAPRAPLIRRCRCRADRRLFSSDLSAQKVFAFIVTLTPGVLAAAVDTDLISVGRPGVNHFIVQALGVVGTLRHTTMRRRVADGRWIQCIGRAFPIIGTAHQYAVAALAFLHSRALPVILADGNAGVRFGHASVISKAIGIGDATNTRSLGANRCLRACAIKVGRALRLANTIVARILVNRRLRAAIGVIG